MSSKDQDPNNPRRGNRPAKGARQVTADEMPELFQPGALGAEPLETNAAGSEPPTLPPDPFAPGAEPAIEPGAGAGELELSNTPPDLYGNTDAQDLDAEPALSHGGGGDLGDGGAGDGEFGGGGDGGDGFGYENYDEAFGPGDDYDPSESLAALEAQLGRRRAARFGVLVALLLGLVGGGGYLYKEGQLDPLIERAGLSQYTSQSMLQDGQDQVASVEPRAASPRNAAATPGNTDDDSVAVIGDELLDADDHSAATDDAADLLASNDEAVNSEPVTPSGFLGDLFESSNDAGDNQASTDAFGDEFEMASAGDTAGLDDIADAGDIETYDPLEVLDSEDLSAAEEELADEALAATEIDFGFDSERGQTFEFDPLTGAVWAMPDAPGATVDDALAELDGGGSESIELEGEVALTDLSLFAGDQLELDAAAANERSIDELDLAELGLANTGTEAFDLAEPNTLETIEGFDESFDWNQWQLQSVALLAANGAAIMLENEALASDADLGGDAIRDEGASAEDLAALDALLDQLEQDALAEANTDNEFFTDEPFDEAQTFDNAPGAEDPTEVDLTLFDEATSFDDSSALADADDAPVNPFDSIQTNDDEDPFYASFDEFLAVTAREPDLEASLGVVVESEPMLELEPELIEPSVAESTEFESDDVADSGAASSADDWVTGGELDDAHVSLSTEDTLVDHGDRERRSGMLSIDDQLSLPSSPGGLEMATPEDFAHIWPYETLPLEAVAGERVLLTPAVGGVRLHTGSNETFDGVLYSVGNGAWVIDNSLGRMALEAKSIVQAERLANLPLNRRTSAFVPTGDRVRVRTNGGFIYGHVLSQGDDHVTLLTDGDGRITISGGKVEPTSQRKSGAVLTTLERP